MEQQVLELVQASQSSDQARRQGAELQLKQLSTHPNYPLVLASVGTNPGHNTADRVSALIILKLFVAKSWSPHLDEHDSPVLVGDHLKDQLRSHLLAIAFDSSVDSKIIAQTAAIITKIAKADYPEAWPNLLDELLGQQARSNDAQTDAILVIVNELVEGGLDEDQFFKESSRLVTLFHDVAVNIQRKLLVRAHAVAVFRGCMDFVETVKDREDVDIKGFMRAFSSVWEPFFMEVLTEPLPTMPTTSQELQPDSEVVMNWRGVVGLKCQVALTLTKLQNIFNDVLPCQAMFTACWTALQTHGQPYFASFVDGRKQSNLFTSNGLAYTLDGLVIAELDLMQTLLESPAVKGQLDEMARAALEGNDNPLVKWVMEMVSVLVTFSAITLETQEMWDIEFNTFLSEETFAETNTTPRSACASFIWNVCAWLPFESLKCMVEYMKLVWKDPNPSWQYKEASLYMLQQVVEEFKGENRVVDSTIKGECIEYVASAIHESQHLLRARGHIVMGAIMTAWMAGPDGNQDIVLGHAHQSLKAMTEDDSTIVKTACIRLMSTYMLGVSRTGATEMQVPVVTAIARFLDNEDMSDMDENAELVDAVLQTLRDLTMANPANCLNHNALKLMLTLVELGAARDETTFILVEEGFESAAQAMANEGATAYAQFCANILPWIITAFDSQEENGEKKEALIEVALNLLKLLAATAVTSLPDEFVSAAMPRLCRLIFSEADFYLHQQATLAIKEMLSNDHNKIFAWVEPDSQKGGLEMMLLIIGHLLGPQVDDASAGEVGDLAVEVVEKAGPAALGSAMRDLLQVVAVRLSTAEHLGLIQSLVMVFARLSLVNAQDVVNFLAEIQVGQTIALNVVINKWLDNSTHFVGFEAVRQNTMALVAFYGLHDARLAALNVQGDMIIDSTTTRIKTRSMATSRPIQYTTVTAELKLVKLLVQELVPYYAPVQKILNGGSPVKLGSDGSWESASGTPNLSPVKADDETQKFLVQFFNSVGAEPRFQELYGLLTEGEQKRLMEAVQGHQALEAQLQQLAQ